MPYSTKPAPPLPPLVVEGVVVEDEGLTISPFVSVRPKVAPEDDHLAEASLNEIAVVLIAAGTGLEFTTDSETIRQIRRVAGISRTLDLLINQSLGRLSQRTRAGDVSLNLNRRA